MVRPILRPIPRTAVDPLINPNFNPDDPNNNKLERCRRLAEKIENLKKEVYEKRYPDLMENPGNLPQYIGPGEKLRYTVRGYEKLLNRQLRRLEELQKKFEDECNCFLA